jgi:4-hydroxy-tetrahydrodipicolinate reductase
MLCHLARPRHRLSSSSVQPAVQHLRLAIAGASGRMGRMLLEAVSADASVKIAAALEHAASPMLGHDVGSVAQGVKITADFANALKLCDVLIDFTRPEGTLAHLAACKAHGVKAVIGTTGFSPAQKKEIADFAEHIPIVFAPNMSVGVNVTLKLVEQAAKSLGFDFDIEVFEAHHKLKVDAPSGTALALGEAVAAARGQTLADVAVYERHGVTGERQAGSIGFSVVRAGDIIGDHTVFFAGAGERIEITHKASSRATYAHGALRAAKFLMDKSRGLFDMQDVLGLKP